MFSSLYISRMTGHNFHPSTTNFSGIRPSRSIFCIHHFGPHIPRQLVRNHKVASDRRRICCKLNKTGDNSLPSTLGYECIRLSWTIRRIWHKHRSSRLANLYRCIWRKLSHRPTTCNVCFDRIRQLQTTFCSIDAGLCIHFCKRTIPCLEQKL